MHGQNHIKEGTSIYK